MSLHSGWSNYRDSRSYRPMRVISIHIIRRNDYYFKNKNSMRLNVTSIDRFSIDSGLRIVL
jgi:hypothetical protein